MVVESVRKIRIRNLHDVYSDSTGLLVHLTPVDQVAAALLDQAYGSDTKAASLAVVHTAPAFVCTATAVVCARQCDADSTQASLGEPVHPSPSPDHCCTA
jgi:DNA-binding IclR family transcriptional regulator